MADNPNITAEYVRAILAYDPAKGTFFWNRGFGRNYGPAGTKKDSGYIRIVIDKKSYYAHRIAWLYMMGVWPEQDTDHKDGNPSNNKWENLRAATRTLNNANRKKKPLSKNSLKGVYWHKKNLKWCASIRIDGREKYLGSFDTEEDAHSAYIDAANKAFGEFARF